MKQRPGPEPLGPSTSWADTTLVALCAATAVTAKVPVSPDPEPGRIELAEGGVVCVATIRVAAAVPVIPPLCAVIDSW